MLSNYSKLNNLIGWLVFAVAALTYLLTVEPTVSFWDCGEYIATSAKLQVGHPPGAPFFQLVGNVFSQFALGDVTQQAYMVNLVSALSSAFTILFLFWTITALGRKFALKYGELSDGRVLSIFGSGVVGALAYTFSDSFWFSATEGEVYAMSSLFTAIAFWAIFKWENEVDTNPRANRWLVFIAYMTGLSIGVHILVFLTIPAIAMIYFFKKDKEITVRKFIMYNVIAIIILGVVFAGIIPLILNSFGKLEIIFVNSFGLPFNSGTIFALLLLIGLSVWGLRVTRVKDKPLLNTAILSTLFIVLGYSTFITLAIRSNANTPIDENNPEDALSLLAYYKREQYGDWPVLYGQYFNAPLDERKPFLDGSPVYKRDDESGKYVITDDRKQSVRNFDARYKGFFPRMWSDDGGHVENYIEIADIKNKDKRPTFGQNIRFFFDYQLGHMWWRYFLWNFVGRQNDEQHRYEITKGNWLSGVNAIDAMRLGPQENLPYHLENNPARNTYYFLPFLLGLVGLFFHFKKSDKDAWAVLLFFLLTGIAVVIYTNHKPFEPRERDYAFVGSFYAFAIWIGLGVQAIYELLSTKMKTGVLSAGVLSAACVLLVPGIMAAENWDDHDRSNRYTARDIAKAYLDSCEPNAILFTNGDNDTFPLWYVQEVEGYRTDVRIVNLSLLNTDWYIDQQKRAAYDAAPVPFSFEESQYQQGTRDVLYYRQDPRIGDVRWPIEGLMKWIKSDDPQTRFDAGGKQLQYYPVKKVRVNINKEQVLANQVVAPQDTGKIVEYIDWDLNSSILSKRDLMVVDLIANNDWTRPIYFSVTVGNSSKSYFWLEEYFELEGLAYRFVPIRHGKAPRGTADFGKVDSDVMYNNLMNKFSYGNMELPGVYLDETNRRLSYNLRNSFGRLANQLADEGKNEKAIEVLDRAMELMPEEKFEFNYFVMGILEGYYKAGATEKAVEIATLFEDRIKGQLEYFKQFSRKEQAMANQDIRTALSYYQLVLQLRQQYEYATSPQEFQQSPMFQSFNAYANSFASLGQR
jgi:tetratricopeptide (TPR) repeat protein/MFS family permease